MPDLGGHVHFPVQGLSPEAQRFFDQGVTQQHGFWYFEAERSFRQVALLHPECAMAYLGLARAVPYERDRAEAFLRQAVQHQARATPHEQRWIAAFADTYLASLDHLTPARPGWNAGTEELAEALQKLIVDYPEDIDITVEGLGERDGDVVISAFYVDVVDLFAQNVDHLD